MARTETRYIAGPTANRFHQSRAFVRGILGPVGSGKSVACVAECLRMIAQLPASRGAVVRNTYRELEDTTLATWMDWARPFGEFKHRTMTHSLNIGGCRADVLFRALDKPQDIGKLLSLELTWAWLNEAREIPRAIVDMVQTRIQRYPAKRDWHENREPFWSLIMDTNPPDDMHWWFRLFEEQRPEGWELFRQPGGREADAENTQNLPPGYYERISLGKDDAWIRVYVDGQYGFVLDGKPVYPEFNDRIHVQVTEPDSRQPVYVGLDFGLTPAAAFAQQLQGQYQVHQELVTDDYAATEFAELLGQTLRRDWQGADVIITGDPAGEQRAQTDKRTPFQILAAHGIKARPATSQDATIRREAVAGHLRRMTMAGEPGLVVDPRCKYLRRGLGGGYKYRQLQVKGDERYHPTPEKNIYSHVCEALEYGLLGAGEGRAVVGRQHWEPINYGEINRSII